MSRRPVLLVLSVVTLLPACTGAKGAPSLDPGTPSCLVELDQWGRRLSAKVQGEWAHVNKGVFTETRVYREGNSIFYKALGTREIATTDGRSMTYNYGLGFRRSVDVTRDEMEIKAGLMRHRYRSSGACQPEDRALGVAALELALQQEEQQRQQNSN